MQAAATEEAAAATALSSSSGAVPATFTTVDGRNNDDEDDDAQIPVDMEPAYTPQDEQRDLASLTIADMVKVQSDLTGITLGMFDLRVDQMAAEAEATAASANSMSEALYLLDLELAKLPAAQTEVYRRALKDYPHLVTDERRMQFLECEEFDAALAARRLAKHWKLRMELFGSDRCFLPMTMAGAMKGEVEKVVERRIEQILPVTDTAGRAILYEDASRRNLAEYSMEEEARGVWYMLETLTEIPEVRRRGVVIIVNASAMQREHYSRKMTLLTEVEYSVVPIRMRAVHICHPNPVVYYVIVPVIKRFLPKDVRLRIKLYYGSIASVLQQLEGHSLPKDRLPVELGGALNVDMTKWALDRLALETCSPDPTASAHIDGPAAKRARGESGPESKPSKLHEAIYPNIAAVTAEAAAAADTSTTATCTRNRSTSTFKSNVKSETRNRGDGRGGRSNSVASRARSRSRGRESDPRMTKAVEIRFSDRKVSPLDALRAGGFVFREDPSKNDMVDEDGITLAQRKNNLCRRIRRLRERAMKEEAAAQSKEGECDVISEQDEATGLSNQDIETTSTKKNLDSGVADSLSANDDDSFYDAINELPGIKEREECSCIICTVNNKHKEESRLRCNGFTIH